VISSLFFLFFILSRFVASFFLASFLNFPVSFSLFMVAINKRMIQHMIQQRHQEMIHSTQKIQKRQKRQKKDKHTNNNAQKKRKDRARVSVLLHGLLDVSLTNGTLARHLEPVIYAIFVILVETWQHSQFFSF